MKSFYDTIIIGGGPGGLSAALYAARAKLKTLVFEKGNIGGQITTTEEVVNYPGIEKTSGWELTNAMRKQAMSFGAKFIPGEVLDVQLQGNYKTINTSKGEYRALSVIIATGANPRQIGFPGEKEFQGHGVGYCATCDGHFFTGLDVFVIGAGFAAAEEAMFLTRFARRVRIIAREPDFTCAKTIGDKVKVHKGIDIYFNTEVKEVGGKDSLEYAIFKNNQTGEVWEYRPSNPKETFGVFVFAGYVPNSILFKDKVKLDEWGYIVTDSRQNTNVDGVCAVGDVCAKDLRQVVTAVSDGAVAAVTLEKYIEKMYSSLGIDEEEMDQHTEDEKKIPPDYNKEVHRLLKSEDKASYSSFITPDMASQLKPVFEKLTKELHLTALLDDSRISRELEIFLEELSLISPRISCSCINCSSEEASPYRQYVRECPSLLFLNENKEYLGLQYHGVPGGLEFNSFILAIYNAAGPGQIIEPDVLSRIKALSKPVHLKIFVSLSCTMCPGIVMACQRIALENPSVETEIFDLAHFPDYKGKYNIMSVPCLVINDNRVSFGSKNIKRVLDIIEQ